jgi:class 3 adenylate cyclase/tetratricopeptide (TPR) repeat protein
VSTSLLEPYVPTLVTDPQRPTWVLDGSMVFADVSGFTKLSEKLAEQGKAGAEELTDILLGTFTDLLGEARDEGGDLLKYGGDALFLAFEGPGHAARACRAAHRMRAALKARGPIETGKGRVVLRISQGVHTGRFHLVLAGDQQRELLIIGPDATLVTDIEGAASAGEVVVSQATAALLPSSYTGRAIGPGLLLRREPDHDGGVAGPMQTPDIDRTTLVPAAVRRRVEAGDLESEHRRVAVGFLHIMGVDDYLATNGPEQTAAALSTITTAVATAAADANTCLLASDLAPDGAKLIITAGTPEGVEDIEGRLLLTLRSVFDQELPLPIRAGAHSGHVFASNVGAPWRHVFTVIGDAVNLSARLMGKAQPGQIVASRALLDNTATAFVTEPLEPFMVKGKRHPQHASLVGKRVLEEPRSERMRPPFIGREDELRALTDALGHARDGHGSCIELIGPPGIGKSRLLDELIDRANGIPSVRITCEPFQSDRPYYVSRLLLRRVLGIAFDADRRTAGRILVERVEEVAPAQVPWVPLLATVIDADADDTPEVLALDPAFRSQVLHETAADFFEAILRTPGLLILEDAMWIDDASEQMLARVMRDIADRPWLVCTTLRQADDGFARMLGFDSRRIEISPLPEQLAGQLAKELTEDAGISMRDIERLCERAGGNPLYLVELLRAVLDSGSQENLPDRLEDILAARIDRLPRPDRTVLRVGAVLGDRFDRDLLASTLGDDMPYPASRAAGRLSGYLIADGTDLVFEHGLVREVAYELLPYSRRRDLHKRAADVLSALPGRPDDDRLSLIAHHRDLAGERLLAWEALRRAGDRAARKFAHHEAASLYERAIENARRVDTVPASDLADVAERLGDSAEVSADFALAQHGYRLARKLVDADDERQVDLLRKEGMVREKEGRYEAALRWLRRGLSDIRANEPTRREAVEHLLTLRAEFEVSYAGVRFRQGKLRNCVRWCESAIDDAERADARKTLAHALYLIEGALTDLGDPRAAEYEGRSVAIYRELGDHLGMGHALLNMGVNAVHRGELDRAVDLYEQAREALRTAGHVIGLAHVSLNLGEVLADQGRLDEAELFLKDARRAASASQYRMINAAAQSALGRVAVRRGHFDRGLALLGEAEATFEEMKAASWMVETSARIAESLAFAGRFDEALAAIDDALAIESEAAIGGIVPLLERSRARALAGLGRLDEARSALELSAARATADGADLELALTLEELAHLAASEKERSDASARAQEIATRMGIDLAVVVPEHFSTGSGSRETPRTLAQV